MFSKIKRSSFIKNLSKLIFGSVFAQIITLISTVFIVRLFTAEAIGEYAIVIALTQIVSVFLSLKYELSIMNSGNDKEAYATTIAIFAVVFILSLVGMGAFLLISPNFELPEYLVQNKYVIFLIFTISTLVNVLSKHLNRLKLYSVLSLKPVLQSVIINVSQISFGAMTVFSDSRGLMYGYLLGSICSFSFFSFYMFHQNKKHLTNIKLSELIRLLLKFRNFPLYNIPNGLLSKATAELPIFLLNLTFGTQVVGYFSLTRRVLSQPIKTVSSNIGLIFHQKVGEFFHGRSRGLKRLTFKTIFLLIAIVIPFAIIILVFGKDIFQVLFGEVWITSAEYAVYLLPLIVCRFVTSPIASIYLVSNRSGELLVVNFGRLILSALGFYIGYSTGSVECAILLYSSFAAVGYILNLMRLIYLSNYYEVQKHAA